VTPGYSARPDCSTKNIGRLGHFQVLLWFWDDYVTWLNAYSDLQQRYYDQINWHPDRSHVVLNAGYIYGYTGKSSFEK
jgi:hypothetical protein